MENMCKIEVVANLKKDFKCLLIFKVVIGLFIAFLFFVQLYKCIDLNKCFAVSLTINILRE